MATKRKKFGQELGSIDSRLHQLPKAVRRRYRRNRAKSEADYRAMMAWAAQGCLSGGVESDQSVHFDDEDVLRLDGEE